MVKSHDIDGQLTSTSLEILLLPNFLIEKCCVSASVVAVLDQPPSCRDYMFSPSICMSKLVIVRQTLFPILTSHLVDLEKISANENEKISTNHYTDTKTTPEQHVLVETLF